MTTDKQSKPIYDKRVNEILQGLKQGKSREELAVEFEHSDYRSLDQYMRRRNFTWDKQEKNYVPKLDDSSVTTSQTVYNKTQKIIALLAEGIDLDEVAERVGLGDIETLGKYMTEKGYKWNSKKRTYIELAGIVTKDGSVQAIPNTSIVQQNVDEKISKEIDSNALLNEAISTEMEQLLPSIHWLHQHLHELQKIINDRQVNDQSQFPRYKIRGDAKVKSIQMALGLQAVANQFCSEFNIVQKEFYEVAIIECLMKYGYSFEVQNLLRNN